MKLLLMKVTKHNTYIMRRGLCDKVIILIYSSELYVLLQVSNNLLRVYFRVGYDAHSLLACL